MVPNFSSLRAIEILNDDTTIHFVDYFVQSTFLYPDCASFFSFLDALLNCNAAICDGVVNNDSTSGKYLPQGAVPAAGRAGRGTQLRGGLLLLSDLLSCLPAFPSSL